MEYLIGTNQTNNKNHDTLKGLEEKKKEFYGKTYVFDKNIKGKWVKNLVFEENDFTESHKILSEIAFQYEKENKAQKNFITAGFSVEKDGVLQEMKVVSKGGRSMVFVSGYFSKEKIQDIPSFPSWEKITKESNYVLCLISKLDQYENLSTENYYVLDHFNVICLTLEREYSYVMDYLRELTISSGSESDKKSRAKDEYKNIEKHTERRTFHEKVPHWHDSERLLFYYLLKELDFQFKKEEQITKLIIHIHSLFDTCYFCMEFYFNSGILSELKKKIKNQTYQDEDFEIVLIICSKSKYESSYMKEYKPRVDYNEDIKNHPKLEKILQFICNEPLE